MAANHAAETELSFAKEPASGTESLPTVLLICVKYGSDQETALYLESLRSLNRQQTLRVLVVDNASEGGPARLPEWPNCSRISAPDNLGYFGGARYGLSLHLRNNPLPDWIIISNVDLLIVD